MPEQTLTLPAPAKLNLFLHIIGRRPDGYHELQTLFQLLDMSDTLTFTPNSSQGIRFSCSDASLETDDNLVIRAARALERHTEKTFHVDIHLTKALPMGGGIGGGSSDCATTLLGLNKLLDLNLNTQTLQSIGAKLGADVPVFVRGKTAWAEGIGERLTDLPMPEHWFVIIHPNVHVSTAELFSHPELTRDTPASTIRAELAGSGHNDFEPLVRRLYPDIDKAFRLSSPYGNARLTGTGACLFMSMQNKEMAEHAAMSIRNNLPDVNVFLAQGTNVSTAVTQLHKRQA